MAKLSKLAKSKAKVDSRYWRVKADTKWSESVRNRAGNKCEVCGSTNHVQAHHIVDRSIWQLRHDLTNGICVCVLHHKYNRLRSAHKGTLLFHNWMRERWPERIRLLVLQANLIEDDTDLVLVGAEGWNEKRDYKAAYKRLTKP